MILSLVSAAIGVVLVLAVSAYIEMKARAISDYGHHSQGFFDAADKLAACDDAPLELLQILYALNETISNSRAYLILFSYLSDQSRWSQKDSDFYVRNKALAEYFHRRPELEPLYGQVLAGWFLAITSRSPLLGRLARFALVEGVVEGAAFRRIQQGVSADQGPHQGANQALRA